MKNVDVQHDIAITKLADDSADVTQKLPTEAPSNEAATEQQPFHSLESATEMVTATQSPITLASLLQENEFLKSELEVYKQELIVAREAYERELKLYTLAHAISAAERSAEKDQYSECMCNQCGNIYQQASYKIVEVPLPGTTPASTPVILKKEHPAVTKEPTRPSRVFEKEVKPKIS